MTASSDLTRFSNKPSLASIDVRRLMALCFPHWIFWALTLIVLAIDLVIDISLPQLEVAAAGYQQICLTVLTALAPIAWRYWRFESFDWFTHRAWNILMLVLWVAATSKAVGLLGFELAALKFPLSSALLNTGDRALGFDWNAYASFVLGTKWSEWFFFHAYNGAADIAIKATFVFPLLLNNRVRLLEACFLSTATGIICSVVGGLLPAFPAFNTVAHQQIVDQLNANGHFSLHGVADQFLALRTATFFHVEPPNLVGLVNFPSYHCCVALIIIFCSRGLGWVSVIQALVGICIIISTPVFGGHYLTDLLGGAAVWVGCFATWHYLLRPRVARVMPGTGENDFSWPKKWHFAKHFAYR